MFRRNVDNHLRDYTFTLYREDGSRINLRNVGDNLEDYSFLPLYSEDGVSTFHRNVNDLPNYRASSQNTADQIFV